MFRQLPTVQLGQFVHKLIEASFQTIERTLMTKRKFGGLKNPANANESAGCIKIKKKSGRVGGSMQKRNIFTKQL